MVISLNAQVQWYLSLQENELIGTRLDDYIWHVEQLLQNLKKRRQERQGQRPLAPFTRP